MSIFLSLSRLALAAAVAVLIVWSFLGLHFDLTHFGTGLQRGGEYVGKMFPRHAPDWRYDRALLGTLWPQFLTTIQMAIVGTTLGAALAFPVSFVAAPPAAFRAPSAQLLRPI